jgi:fructuronate reductase
MVDRIVPATTADDRRAVTAAAGLMDEGAVLTEPFSQWVIEDRFAGPRPRWEKVGASLVADVDPYERAKLRLLNGAHSFLAYAGLLKGHAHVHDAMGDPDLAAAVRTLMLDEAAPTLSPAPGQDLAAYAESLIARFANPALNHRLIQIAMDGSQKIPQRWLETLAEGQKAGRPCPVLLRGLAAWLRHVRGDNFAAWGEVSDPLAAQLAGCFPKGQPDMSALFGPTGLVSQVWTPLPQDLHLIANSMT